MRELLRCPITHQPLSSTGEGHLQTESGERYPIIDGVPVLLDEAHSLFVTADVVGTRVPAEPTAPGGLEPPPPPTLAARLLALVPNNSRNIGADERYARLAELVRARARPGGGPPRVLLLGAQVAGAGTDQLTQAADITTVETDVDTGPRTQVVCDAQELPFQDAAFDAVVAQAMIDMVADPGRVASEVHRVLAPGGLVLSEVAFMQQIRGGAYDFTRYTLLGHRRLWRCFDQIDAGAQCGPGMALGWSLTAFAQSFARGPRLALVFKRIMQVATSWLPLFDPLLVKRPGGIDAAAGTFFLGSRRKTAITDRALAADYQGLARWGLKPEADSSPGVRAPV